MHTVAGKHVDVAATVLLGRLASIQVIVRSVNHSASLHHDFVAHVHASSALCMHASCFGKKKGESRTHQAHDRSSALEVQRQRALAQINELVARVDCLELIVQCGDYHLS